MQDKKGSNYADNSDSDASQKHSP
ncbi:hypothetical protein BCEP27_31027 [Burkholderia cepacia]